MCFGPSSKANRAPARVLGAPTFSKEALLALEQNLGRSDIPRRQSNPATDSIYPPFNVFGLSGQLEHQASVLSPAAASVTDRTGNSPRASVETDWSSPTLNDTTFGNSPDYDGSKLALNNGQMISQDLIASLSASLYDDKTAAAIGAALLDPNNALFSPELLDAVSPFLASNTNYNPMIGADASAAAYGAGNQDDMQFFPAMVEYADQMQSYDAQPDNVDSEQGSYASGNISQAPFHVSGSLKRSGDLYELDAGSSTLSADDHEDHDDESDEEDDEYHEPGRRAHGSHGSDKRKQGQKASDGQPAAKKPRTRPPNADDILLKTDPALVEKLLVPVRKRRQPKAIDPSLPPEVVEKRIKNTEAARRSRLRKTLKMDQLEQRVIDLEKEREEMLELVASLERERDEWKARCFRMQQGGR